MVPVYIRPEKSRGEVRIESPKRKKKIKKAQTHAWQDICGIPGITTRARVYYIYDRFRRPVKQAVARKGRAETKERKKMESLPPGVVNHTMGREVLHPPRGRWPQRGNASLAAGMRPPAL